MYVQFLNWLYQRDQTMGVHVYILPKKQPCKLILITLEEFQRVKASANDASRSLKYRYIDY